MPLRLRRASSQMSVNPPVVKKPAMDGDQDSDVFSADTCEVYEFENTKHAGQVLTTFNQLRQSGLFTDVILSAANREFPCHRAVLVAGSRYFRAMFCNDHKESREMLVQINGMQADVMDLLLDYLYTSRASITADNVQLLLEASNLFQITSLGEACTKFLEAQLDPCNCIGMREFAEAHALSELFKKASELIMDKFADVVVHEEFLELPKTRVIDYISDDDINVSREEIVYEAVKRWVAHDPVVRSEDFAELLSYVRVPLIHPSYFVNVVECDEQVSTNPACQAILQETRKYHILGNEINSARTRPRRSTGCSAAVVIVGGYDRVGGYNMPQVEAFDPVTGHWGSLAKLPAFTKSEYAVASFRNSIIVSGGRIHSRDVWLYQSHLDNWVKIAPMCKGRWRHRMVTLGGHVYSVGGYDGKNKLKSVERYDSFCNSWLEIPPMLMAVSSCALATCNGKLYVIGGGGEDPSVFNKVQCYNPDTNQWTMKAALPSPHHCVSTATHSGKIFVLGGTEKMMHICDPLNNSWSSTSVTGDKLENCGITVCGGKLYITGGKGEGPEASDAIFCYDVATGSMEQVAVMPRPSFHHGCVTIHRFGQGSAQATEQSTSAAKGYSFGRMGGDF
uniref:Kelch-like protein 24 n=1 Tax=Phallusia mammillata TaxID=59560 RepID=A0A6F9DFC1_9ASCI|nr:kelch-like protein 24 [Phallusia mammillata]